jgi:hypothetical protein
MRSSSLFPASSLPRSRRRVAQIRIRVHAVTHAQSESLGLRTFALLCCFHADLRDLHRAPSSRRQNFRNTDEVEEGLIIGDPATKWRQLRRDREDRHSSDSG